MSRRSIDLAGQSFGALTAIRPDGRDKSNHMNWECACVCGRTTVARSAHLRRGEVKSCGKRSHGRDANA
jgi:hypothetical protein